MPYNLIKILCEKLYSKSQGFLDEHLSNTSDSLVILDLLVRCLEKVPKNILQMMVKNGDESHGRKQNKSPTNPSFRIPKTP